MEEDSQPFDTSDRDSSLTPVRRRKLLRPLEEYPVEILEVVLGILLAQKGKRPGGEPDHDS